MPDKTNIILEDRVISQEEKVCIEHRDNGFKIHLHVIQTISMMK